MLPRDSISEAIRNASAGGKPALVAFMTAGFPSRERFAADLLKVGEAADLIEIGLPFSDPMADGMTIQRSSRVALANGVTLDWMLAELMTLANRPRAPLLLMSYLNPLLAHGIGRLAADACAAGIAGFIVPDLPFEECAELRAALAAEGIALVQMVTPVTPAARLAMLARESEGFVYAVTMTGTTGRDVAVPDAVLDYLDRVGSTAAVPVCAGFGIRHAAQVARLAGHADGVIVGSALVEVLERDGDPAEFLRSLRSI
ncbi:MAG: Tryptophan synthase alpha chain [Steroidobacteraceae bacterium]|nr:Tryptophan synthase alpha chain [Steroidobacteraceae bacterium]MBM2853347.1 Tryptophan synthase alpha chain [Steroidobacteraceae bacterium]